MTTPQKVFLVFAYALVIGGGVLLLRHQCRRLREVQQQLDAQKLFYEKLEGSLHDTKQINHRFGTNDFHIYKPQPHAGGRINRNRNNEIIFTIQDDDD